MEATVIESVVDLRAVYGGIYGANPVPDSE